MCCFTTALQNYAVYRPYFLPRSQGRRAMRYSLELRHHHAYMRKPCTRICVVVFNLPTYLRVHMNMRIPYTTSCVHVANMYSNEFMSIVYKYRHKPIYTVLSAPAVALIYDVCAHEMHFSISCPGRWSCATYIYSSVCCNICCATLDSVAWALGTPRVFVYRCLAASSSEVYARSAGGKGLCAKVKV